MDIAIDTELEEAWQKRALEEEQKVLAQENAGIIPPGTWDSLRDDILTYRRKRFIEDWEDAKIRDQRVIETDEELLRKYRAQKDKRFEIFSDGSGLMVGPDDYVLVGALSGQGKSTFGLQTVCHAISKGRKAMYISAEEGEAQVLENMSRILHDILPPGRYVDIPRMRSIMCKLIGPQRSKGMTACFDMVMDIVRAEAKYFNPEVIVLDNLNVMTNPGLPIHKVDRRFMDGMSKQKIDYLSHEIFSQIQKESGFPAIIALQQLKVGGVPGYKSAEKPGQMQAHLADTARTIKDSTLAMMIMRDTETMVSYMHLGKNRDMRGRPIDQMSTWKMTPGRSILVKETGAANPWLNQKVTK